MISIGGVRFLLRSVDHHWVRYFSPATGETVQMDLHAVHTHPSLPQKVSGWSLTRLAAVAGAGEAVARYTKNGVVLALRCKVEPFGVRRVTLLDGSSKKISELRALMNNIERAAGGAGDDSSICAELRPNVVTSVEEALRTGLILISNSLDTWYEQALLAVRERRIELLEDLADVVG